MNKYFDEIKKNFGFGCMRLPMRPDGEVDVEETKKMVDLFIAGGFNYFDTAHGYLGKRSEAAVKAALTSRYPRESYILADKLTGHFFDSEDGIRPLLDKQLEICGVDYFDFYLMHAQNRDVYAKFKRCRAYETAFELKKEGKVRHVGLSFHDTPDVLDTILTEYPEIEVVQIQFNYLDYDDPAIESRECYEVCIRHDKPIIIMEPVKGGNLINLPDKAKALVDGAGISPANLAVRFAASPKNVFMVLSGMSNTDQVRENIAFMSDFKPLTERECDIAAQIAAIIRGQNLIPCTACHYCTDGCPMKISIPDLFACYNIKQQFSDNWNARYYYDKVYTSHGGKASECIGCGQCEAACPQHLEIRQLLEKVASMFEGK